MGAFDSLTDASSSSRKKRPHTCDDRDESNSNELVLENIMNWCSKIFLSSLTFCSIRPVPFALRIRKLRLTNLCRTQRNIVKSCSRRRLFCYPMNLTISASNQQSPSLSMPPIYELPIFDRHVCLQPTPKYTRGHSQMIRFRTTIGRTGGWKSFYDTRNRLIFILEPSEDQTDERRTYFLLRTLFGYVVEMYSPSYFRSAWRPHGWK